MSKRRMLLWIIVVLLAGLLAGCGTQAEPTAAPEPAQALAEPTAAVQPAGENKLILATTTSTEDSGLLAYILPDFQTEAGVTVEVVAVGTGQAIEIGAAGDADVLLVHARAREDEFMAAGHGVRREDVMYNDFVIVGPPSDRAGIKGLSSAAEALAKIAESESPFISRGDDSGTHTKELSVWKAAGIEPSGAWYISAGQGMGAVLTMADEQLAYTLSDRATYLARTKEGTELVVLVEGDEVLFNPYGVIAVNPNKGEHIKADLANRFIDWLISVPVQEKIGEFGIADLSQSLFIPDSAPYREAHPQQASEPAGGGVSEDAALKVTGKVMNEIGWTEDEVKAMPTMDVQATNKQGETQTYTGVLISALLAPAAPQPGGTAVVFVADDGYTAEISLAEILTCVDCIVSFRNQGGFSTVLPGKAGELQVKGVVEIQVK